MEEKIMRINNNVTAINAHRNYGVNSASIGKNVEKLSSGYRINRAGDDAAGLAISEKMRAQIRGLNMASKNSQDAVSLIQTAEGALQSTHNVLQRMRELAVQSASDTNEQTVDRAALQAEFEQLKAEINDTAAKTRFNDQNLIDGTFSKYLVQIGAATDVNTVTIASGNSVRVSATGKEFGTWGVTVTGQDYADTTTTGGTASTAATFITAGTYVTGATFEGLASSSQNGNTYKLVVDDQGADNVVFKILDSNNQAVGTSEAIDLNTWTTAGAKVVSFGGFGKVTFTTTAGTASQISSELLGSDVNGKDFSPTGGADAIVTPAKQASATITLNGEAVDVKKGDTSVTFQNSGVTLYFDGGIRDTDLGAAGTLVSDLTGTSVSISALAGNALTIQTGANQGDELTINVEKMNTTALGISGSSIANRLSASRSITEVNTALNRVSTQRAELGALQNRLDFKIANLDTSAENLQAAESRIRDVDMAKEMTAFTKNNILFQASTAMLAQANALPQGVLQLLG